MTAPMDDAAPPTGLASGGSIPAEPAMTIHLELEPLIALAAGVLILLVPRLLNYVVAAYLIAIGILGLLHA